ncbi:RNA polymerase sigma factor RpoE [Litoribrevibacter albus]|uniref:RNA polymerase sigma-H factor n=1 Tax=Litoribrevibacter albus TaxID=1473156 RepID=A0AA37W452_9GAMM|nr:RNA polymerase sigma factor RpoE [Litoribrevibacter albus]GLQ29802.1 RNA polymerase sigma-H factor [Litoribrevibacter albus]
MTTSVESDQLLVERVQKGDKRAFDLLVIKYQSKVLSLISRYVSDAHESMDVAQETFIKAYKALANFRGDSAFYTWLYRIAVNTAKNHLISRGRRPPGTDIDVDEVHSDGGLSELKNIDSPEASLHKEQVEQTLKKALEGLPDDLRTALMLREFDGLSYEDIAQVMDCPVGTVRSRIFRAREAIDKQLEPILETAVNY